LAVLVLLGGCTQWRYDIGSALVEEATPQPESGLSLPDVLVRLGPPHRLSRTADGYVMAWEHWLVREDSLGFSLGFLGADFLSIDWGESRVSGEFLLLGFDREHRLTSSRFSSWDSDAGSGSAIQPLVSAVSVVDTDDLTGRMPQHRWGAASLLRLPEALNLQSRPDMGTTGVQQRGTPSGIGQQSLELD
jgi:hypothetical protein